VISRNCSQINFIAASSFGKCPRIRTERRSFAFSSGYRALYSTTTGQDNTATGFLALVSNTTGCSLAIPNSTISRAGLCPDP
jgi:hypothetical protein